MSRATERVTEKRALVRKSAERGRPAIDKVRLRYTGALSALTPDERASLVRRTIASDSLVRERTEEIIRRVRSDGDRALRDLLEARGFAWR